MTGPCTTEVSSTWFYLRWRWTCSLLIGLWPQPQERMFKVLCLAGAEVNLHSFCPPLIHDPSRVFNTLWVGKRWEQSCHPGCGNSPHCFSQGGRPVRILTPNRGFFRGPEGGVGTTRTSTSDRSVCRFGDMCKSARCPWYHPTASGTTRQPQWEAGSDMMPPRRRTPAAVSVPAEEERARNWEERKQQSNWAQSRPTQGSETSPNRTHNNTQGNHEVRVLQQPPNAAHVERAISNPPPPSSTRCPRTPQGRCPPRGWQQGRDQPTAHGTVHVVRRCEILVRGGRRVGQEWVRERGTQERQQTGGRATQTHRMREPHQEGQGRAQQTRRRGTARQERQPEQRAQGTRMEGGWESVRMGGSDNKGDGQPAPSLPGARATPAQPAQVGGVSRSPDGLFAQQEWEPIRGRPAVRGKSTYGGQPGQRVEEQGLTHTETQQGRLWTACGQRRVDSKNSQMTPATTSTSSIRQLLGAADAQMAHHATSSIGLAHQLLGSARAPAAAADRKQQPDTTCGNMRREEWVTVQGPAKKQQPDEMSHRGLGGYPYLKMIPMTR